MPRGEGRPRERRYTKTRSFLLTPDLDDMLVAAADECKVNIAEVARRAMYRGMKRAKAELLRTLPARGVL